jgi:hypothetical protein
MTLHDMIDIIETSSKTNAYALVEAEKNAISRYKLRALFFKALNTMKESLDAPNDQWEES